jgi:hypothetical protein
MNTPPQPPPLPSPSEIEADARALLAGSFGDDEEGRHVIWAHIEENVQRGVPWQYYTGGMAAQYASYLVAVLQRNGVDSEQWVSEKQAELCARMASGTADDG